MLAWAATATKQSERVQHGTLIFPIVHDSSLPSPRFPHKIGTLFRHLNDPNRSTNRHQSQRQTGQTVPTNSVLTFAVFPHAKRQRRCGLSSGVSFRWVCVLENRKWNNSPAPPTRGVRIHCKPIYLTPAVYGVVPKCINRISLLAIYWSVYDRPEPWETSFFRCCRSQ